MAKTIIHIWKLVWTSLLFNIVLILSPSESADPLSRCSPQLPRTIYLQASEWEKCYEFHMEERTWKNANHVCLSKGGHLVTIKEERIQKFLLKALSDYRWPRNGVWIGATDKEKEMEWLWVTGERVRDGYNRWATGQPSCGLFCFEDCALMRWKESGQWHDYRCNWLEDYSFICEYDMLPEPSTTTVLTTTVPITTSTKTIEVVSTNSTSTIRIASAKTLESENLLHVHGKDERTENNQMEKEKNNNSVVSPPLLVLEGINGARAEQVQERMSESSTGLDSGSIASIIIAVLVSLVVGLCFMLLIMRRRHRKLIREDDRGISYENPYYADSRTNKGIGSHCVDHYTDSETKDEVSTACSDEAGAAVGFTAVAPSRNQTEKKLSHHSQPKGVMNNYDTPPALTTCMPVHASKSSDKKQHSAENRSVTKDNHTSTLPMAKETSNYYDEIKSQYRNSKVTYDVPRSSSHQWCRNDENNYNNDLPDKDEMYYNSNEENIYESVDNLEAIVEQQRHMLQDGQHHVQNDKDEDNNRYVPFMFDTPKES